MTLSNISIGIIIIAASALLELMNKEYEEERRVFESEN